MPISCKLDSQSLKKDVCWTCMSSKHHRYSISGPTPEAYSSLGWDPAIAQTAHCLAASVFETQSGHGAPPVFIT